MHKTHKIKTTTIYTEEKPFAVSNWYSKYDLLVIYDTKLYIPPSLTLVDESNVFEMA